MGRYRQEGADMSCLTPAPMAGCVQCRDDMQCPPAPSGAGPQHHMGSAAPLPLRWIPSLLERCQFLRGQQPPSSGVSHPPQGKQLWLRSWAKERVSRAAQVPQGHLLAEGKAQLWLWDSSSSSSRGSQPLPWMDSCWQRDRPAPTLSAGWG